MKFFSKYGNKKLKAFTLFESVIAISIITTLIGLGSLIYGNLMHAEKPMAYYQALDEIDQHFQEICQTKAFINRDFDSESYQIEQRITLHNGNKNLYRVEYTAFIADKKILTENHLIVNELNE